MRYLRDAWPGVLSRIGRRAGKILFLDFDGTLAAISKRPAAVRLPGGVRRTLDRLSSSYPIVIISGRSLKDLKPRCGLPRAIYVGNHGLQISGLKIEPPAVLRAARRQARCMPALIPQLRTRFRRFPNVVVEDKSLTISIHYRNLHPGRRGAFDRTVAECRKAFERYPVTWRKGKKVCEIRPAHDWGKGEAFRLISRHFPDAFAIVIGDDDTDEDMFRAAGLTGLTVRIGRHRKSRARYYLKSPKDTAQFLSAL